MTKYNKPKNKGSKNPLEVDLGFFGKVNAPKVPADKFFVRAENNQESESVDALRQCYNDILAEHNIPRIEQLITRFLKKIRDAESAGKLKQLMRNVTAEGLVEAKTGRDGRPYHYKPHPRIQRTHELANAWKKRKKELSDRYQKLIGQTDSIRVTDQIKPARAHRPASFSVVLNLKFGQSKKGQETITIKDCLSVHGPTVAIKGSTYITGYSAPQWLEKAARQVKAKLKKQEEEKAKKEVAADKPELTVVPEEEAEKPKTKVKKEEKAA